MLQLIQLYQRNSGIDIRQVVFVSWRKHFGLRCPAIGLSIKSINAQTVKLQAAKPLGKLAVVGNDQPAFGAGNIFDGVKREYCRAARADMTTFIQRPYGVGRIYSPEDGQRMGLAGMIADMVQRCDIDLSIYAPATLEPVANGNRRALAQLITALESGRIDPALREAVRAAAMATPTPVLGITGTGGAGKSSLTDELIRRFRLDQQDALRIAVISIDPSRRKSGGALLGDRIRMNAINHPNIFMR